MKIKHENGKVTFLMMTGKDYVRSTIDIGSAQDIVNKGKSVIEKDGKIIVVDDKYIFPAVVTPKRKKQTEDDAK